MAPPEGSDESDVAGTPARAGAQSAASLDDDAFLRGLRQSWFFETAERTWLTRFVFLRGLGFIHVVAHLVLLIQMEPLIGSQGLLPAADFLSRIAEHTSFFEWPTVFYWNASDAALRLWAWIGMGLSLALMLGVDNALVTAALWLGYMSFCHVGQVFWGYGWETLLLEATFLAIFLCPLRTLRPLPPAFPPPTPVIWLLRWLVFRVMFGAGLIKLRGDACWTDLTCLAFHYETQPVPHPLSWLLHQAPLWFHKLGTAFNHLVELVVPWMVFGPRRVRHVAGGLLLAFQVMLILSGNLSFLNWLTLVVCLACFDDGLLGRVLPAPLVARATVRTGEWYAPGSVRRTILGLCLVVGLLSIGPIVNMLSPRQAMNTSFDPLHLVNSYGAFGAVGKVRHEVVLAGTRARAPDDSAQWREYAFHCKPGDVARRPCLITPYHYRLDWQMWFAALGDHTREPWILHLIYKLLQGDPGVRRLIARDPFGDAPPRHIRAELYRYRFTRLGEATDAFWHRERVATYLEPLSLSHRGFLRALAARGWLRPEHAPGGDP